VLLVSLLGVVAAWIVALTVGTFSEAADSSPPNASAVQKTLTPSAHQKDLGAEVVGERTASSSTFEGADGRMTTRIYPQPVHFRDGDVWRSIDNTLVDGDAGFVHRRANDGDVQIPRSLDRPFTVSKDGAWVRFSLVGGAGEASVSGDSADFASANGVAASYQAVNAGVKETLTLASAQAQRVFGYDVQASDGLRLRRADDGGVEVVDGDGAVRFAFGAPVAWDAAGQPSVSHASDLAVETTDSGWRLTLSVDEAWLKDPARVFPVTVDPDVYWNNGALRHHGALQDCTLASGASASTSFCADPTLKVGSDASHNYNSLLSFDVRSAIPQDSQVYDATLLLYQPGSATQSSSSLRLRRVTGDWTNAATWNTRGGSTAWTTGGGDVSSAAGDMSAPATVGSQGFWYGWRAPADLVQRWVQGTVANQGMQLSADSGSPTQTYTFASTEADPSQWPALDVYWQEDTGAAGSYTMDSQQLTDRSQLQVNVASGNLIYSANDLSLPGTAGHDINVVRSWQAPDSERFGDFGHGWHTNLSDRWLNVTLPNATAVWTDEAGVYYGFVPQSGGGYKTPPGANAVLCSVGTGAGQCSGDGVSAAAYKLTVNKSGRKYYYASNGRPVAVRDRNNNTITFTVASGTHTISGTQGRTVTQHLDGNDMISTMTDGSRTWTYTRAGTGPDPLWLRTYTDPDGKSTTYDYTTDGYLSKITDPLGHETRIEWGAVEAGERKATKVIRVLDATDPTNPVKNPTTTYSYDFANHKTVVTDPVGNGTTTVPHDGETTYTYDKDLQVTTTINALGKETDTSYTPNGDVQTFGDGTGTQNARLSTLTYASSATNNMTGGFTGPSSNKLEQFSVNYCGDTGETTCGSDALQQYRPTRYTGPNGQFQRFGYDTSGNLTDVKDNEDSSAINKAALGYDPAGSDTAPRDGTLRSATDGNGNKTTYGYNSLRQLTSINPPVAGTNGVVGTQLGSTSMTYDSLGRLATLTDGKGQVHTYSYDPLDRLKKDLLSSGDYFQYTYDAAGNLKQRDEKKGASTTSSAYGYDTLNRPSSEGFPGGQSNGYTYTLNSQLATLTTTGGTTSYGYDAIDRVTSITDPSNAQVTYAYDDGTTGSTPRSQTMTMPGGAATKTDFNQSGRPTKIETANSSGAIQRRSYSYADTGAATGTGALVTTMTDLAGITTTYHYNATGLLDDVKKPNGSNTDEWAWAFDHASNRLSKTTTFAGSSTTTSYKYNANNQLCWTVTGTSSNACNNAPTGGIGYTYDADGNQLTGNPTGTFVYDAYNRTTSMGSTSLGYLSPTQNELVSFGSTSMQYTALGLSAEINGSSKTYFIRDPSGNVVAQRRVSGTTLQGTDYFVADNLGSTTGLVTAGSVARSWTYDPDGTPASTGTGASTDLLFAGGQTLTNGLVHYGARYYNPAVGRWTQPDPLDQLADLNQANRYAYAGGNPINLTDATGLSVWDVAKKVTKKVVGAPVSGAGAIADFGKCSYKGAQAGSSYQEHYKYTESVTDDIEHAPVALGKAGYETAKCLTPGVG
jgi:RHS repeat-associated protein